MRSVIFCQQSLAELPHTAVVCLVVVQPLQERHVESVLASKIGVNRRVHLLSVGEEGSVGGGVKGVSAHVQYKV